MIIDFHAHILPPQIKKNRNKYVDVDPCFAMIYSDSKAKIATADELIDDMDRDGVDVSVIVNYGWTTHDLCVETNDYILESIARHPRRLIGFCSVQPNSYEAAAAELERRMADRRQAEKDRALTRRAFYIALCALIVSILATITNIIIQIVK